MSITDRPGQLGGQDIYLRNDRPAAYVRAKVPVTPQRSDIEGDSEGVSPDPLLRHWTQEDFSGGSGYPAWEGNKTGFDVSDGAVWDKEGKWLQPGPRYLIDDTFTDGGPFYVSDTGNVLSTTANAAADRLTFATADATPTWTAEGYAVKAASTPEYAFVSFASGAAKLVTMYSNGDLYEGNALWKAFGGAAVKYPIVEYENLTYVLFASGATELLHVMDGPLAVATSTLLETTPINMIPATATRSTQWLVASDVGPAWLQRGYDGWTNLREYNVSGASASILGRLPRYVNAESLAFAFNSYWVPYVETSGHGEDRKLFLWSLVNGVQSIVGPFLSNVDNGGQATDEPFVLGVSNREEILVYWDEQIWAYDVSDTSIQMLVDTTRHAVSGSTGVDFGAAVGNVIALTHDNGKVAVYDRETSDYDSAATFDLYLGAWDGGYPGVKKQLTSVTVSTLPLAADARVSLAYRFDGSTTWRGVTEVHDVDGASTFTWYPSTQFAAFSGDLVQLRVRLESTVAANRGPFVRKVSASVMPDEAYVEWDLEIDLGDDRSGRLDSKVTSDWLWGLGNETTFVDPWPVRGTDAGESHNVRILERALGPVGRDGPQYARVKLRKVERV